MITAERWIDLLATWSAQAAVVALLVAVILRLGRRLPAGFRYALLVVVLIKMILPPVTATPWSLFGRTSAVETTAAGIPTPRSLTFDGAAAASEAGVANASLNTPAAPAARDDSFAWSTLLIGVHLFGASVFLALLWRERSRLIRRCRGAQAPDARLRAEFDRLAAGLGRPGARLLVDDSFDGPVCFGVRRPTVVLPSWIATGDRDTRRTALAHELVHLAHRDPLVRAVQLLTAAFWWFHPASWWLGRALSRVQEDRCDDAVVRTGRTGREAYCRSLLDVARRRPVGALLIPMATDERTLDHRFRRLLDPSLQSGAATMTHRLLAASLALLLLPATPTSSAAEEEKAAEAVSPADSLRDALAWMSSRQQPAGTFAGSAGDDRWDALAVLAFLGAGNTPELGSHAEVVRRGLSHLESRFPVEREREADEADALAALALVEGATLSADEGRKPVARRAVATLMARFEGDADVDPATSFWSAMTMLSAKDAGIAVDASALARARALSGRTAEDWSPAAAAGAASFLGAIAEETVDASRIDEAVGESLDPIALHLISYARFQAGGESWKTWRAVIEERVRATQQRSGAHRGSWAAPEGFGGGRLGATALATLTLEVSFRYARVIGSR